VFTSRFFTNNTLNSDWKAMTMVNYNNMFSFDPNNLPLNETIFKSDNILPIKEIITNITVLGILMTGK
jgi:hypothetical protein